MAHGIPGKSDCLDRVGCGGIQLTEDSCSLMVWWLVNVSDRVTDAGDATQEVVVVGRRQWHVAQGN